MAIDIDKILGKPNSIIVDGEEHEVRDLATADVLEMASLAGETKTKEDAANAVNRLRAIAGGFFVKKPKRLASWSEAQVKAVTEAIMLDWKARAEKNSASISAAIAAEIERQSESPGSSMQL